MGRGQPQFSITIDENMKIQFLGTGTALSKSRGWSSFVINDSILVDPPPDVTHSLRTVQIDPASIKTILITHFHADHYFGMPFLLLELFYFRPGCSDTVKLVAPSKANEKIATLMSLAYEDVVRDTPEILDILDIHHFQDQSEIIINGVSIIPYLVNHNNIEAYALKLNDGIKVLSFTGDTGMCSQLKELVYDADLLIAEMSNIENTSPDHLNYQDIITLKDVMGSNKIVIATHIRDKAPDCKEIIFANDYDKYEFGG